MSEDMVGGRKRRSGEGVSGTRQVAQAERHRSGTRDRGKTIARYRSGTGVAQAEWHTGSGSERVAHSVEAVEDAQTIGYNLLVAIREI